MWELRKKVQSHSKEKNSSLDINFIQHIFKDIPFGPFFIIVWSMGITPESPSDRKTPARITRYSGWANRSHWLRTIAVTPSTDIDTFTGSKTYFVFQNKSKKYHGTFTLIKNSLDPYIHIYYFWSGFTVKSIVNPWHETPHREQGNSTIIKLAENMKNTGTMTA